jgi:hypothetical protein
MSTNITYLKNRFTGEIKTLRGKKFNPDVFWFGAFYLIKEGDTKTGIIALLFTYVPTLIISLMVPMFFILALIYSIFVLYIIASSYNKERTAQLINEGYEVINQK